MRVFARGSVDFFSFFFGVLVLGSSFCLGYGFLQLLEGFSAPLILLSAHELLCLSAIYFIRRAVGGTSGGSIYLANSFALPRTGVEHAAPFQRGGKVRFCLRLFRVLLVSFSVVLAQASR
jgi:hypothetical protein